MGFLGRRGVGGVFLYGGGLMVLARCKGFRSRPMVPIDGEV